MMDIQGTERAILVQAK